MSQLIRFSAIILIVLVPSWGQVHAAEASSDCLEVAAAQFSEALASATRILNRDAGRCARLPSVDVKQSCANQAFADFEQNKAQAQSDYQASVAACLR
jgi:hypothetical protein